MQKTRRKKVCILSSLFFLIGISMLYIIQASAASPKVKLIKGVLTFVTTDTTATASITWSTEGFIVTREKCLTGPTANGGYPMKKEHGSFLLQPEWKDAEVDPISGKTYVTFTIPEKVVNQALIDAGMDEIGENDTIYLHAIHQVRHNGKPYGGLKYDYPSIRNVEGWANPNDFNDRFDIQATYESSGPQPLKVTYLTADGTVISSKQLAKKDWVSLGNMAGVNFDKTVSYGGKTLYLSKSYLCYLASEKRITGTTKAVTGVNAKDYEQQLPGVRIRKKKQAPGGLEFVAVMREKKQAPEKEDTETVEEALEKPGPYGVIKADQRYQEAFEVTEGIPTTEDLYANVFTSKYLLGYRFKHVSGKKQYQVNVHKTYQLSWTEIEKDADGKEVEVTKSATQAVNKPYTIERTYSYWTIENLDYYKIKKAEVNNYSLPGGTTTLTPAAGYSVPDLTFSNSSVKADHIQEPKHPSTINLGSESVYGQTVPSENFKGEAEAAIGKIMVRNDTLTFDGETVMDGAWRQEKTEKPGYIEVDTEEIGEDILYRSDMMIDRDKANGIYPSSGTVTYERVKALNPDYAASLSYSISGLNEVVIHTPTVCDATISDMAAYNQMLFPDKTVAGLVLDRNFTVCIPTQGSHRYITGYGYRDYGKYIENRQVKFPFDVYQDKTYYRAGTWIAVSSDYTTFYLPIWVNEGKYTIDCKAEAINAAANGATGQTESLANLELSHYVATDTINVEVSGRLYGMSLYDISDYPVWENVFRHPGSLKTTGFNYMAGTKNQNGTETGRNPKYTFPLVNGSHPSYPNIGVIKTGYVTRFYLTSIGNMSSEKDYIRIKPRFFYVNKDGSGRQEVDLYYTETFDGKEQQLVLAGSEQDKKNVKAYRIGDSYLTVPSDELRTKASIEKKDLNQMLSEKRNVFTFTNIMIPETLRTYTGMNYTPTGSVPDGVDPDKVTKSRQKWYCEYYLPSKTHAVKKGFDVMDYAKKHGIDYQEDFWLKEGYIIINFDIETVQNENRHLSYCNAANAPEGYCNMWKLEGFAGGKQDHKGNTFRFAYGDYVMYDTNKSAANDYIQGGTH